LSRLVSKYFNGPTVGACLDIHRGWTYGFDYLRLVLAAAVIGWHSVYSSYGGEFEAPIYDSPFRPLIYLILPMFFVMGGFLVTASLLRTKSIIEYAVLRVVRFLPGLIGVVAVAALLAGPVVSSLPSNEYFGRPQFFAYWLNIAGYTRLTLPGVFLTNPASGHVNIPLWTIPWEFGCSIALCALIIFNLVRRPRLILVGAIILSISIPLIAIMSGNAVPSYARPPAYLLVLSFIPGVCIYIFRYQVPVNFKLFIVALVLTVILLSEASTTVLAPIFIAYSTVYIGLLHPPKYFLMKRADFSYGLYLYGFLVQQMIMYLFPSHRIWWFNLLIALPVAFACAMGSWYLIEGPFLSRKKNISRAAESTLLQWGSRGKRFSDKFLSYWKRRSDERTGVAQSQ
jgi:peptidoglycan/LPS O-acetylase OafA/YrhL